MAAMCVFTCAGGRVQLCLSSSKSQHSIPLCLSWVTLLPARYRDNLQAVSSLLVQVPGVQYWALPSGGWCRGKEEVSYTQGSFSQILEVLLTYSQLRAE